MTKTIAKILIIATALLATTQTYAEGAPAPKSKPEGRTMLVSGILTTSILGGAGVLSAVFWLFSGETDFLLAGAGLAAVGGGVGVPLMVIGGKKYRAWKKSQATVQPVGIEGLTLHDLNSTAQDRYMQMKEQRAKGPQRPADRPVAFPLLAYEF